MTRKTTLVGCQAGEETKLGAEDMDVNAVDIEVRLRNVMLS